MAAFVRFARRPNRVVDSLSANAFGIYLLHYACVSWLQWLLLPASLSGPVKGTLVFENIADRHDVWVSAGPRYRFELTV